MLFTASRTLRAAAKLSEKPLYTFAPAIGVDGPALSKLLIGAQMARTPDDRHAQRMIALGALLGVPADQCLERIDQ